MGLSVVLLACYAVLQVPAALLPPRNLKISSENFKHILTWEDPNNERPIYYKVTYSEMYQKFQAAKDCSNVTVRRCDLTKVLTDTHNIYNIKVQSFTDHDSSKASPSVSLTPIKDTVLGPPIVDVIAGNSCITVSVKPPVSYLWSEDELQYVSMVRDDVISRMECSIQVEDMTQVTSYNVDISKKKSTFFPNLLPNANYCVSVTITDALPNTKDSVPSKPKCVVTENHMKNQDDSTGNSTVYIIVSVVCGVLLLIGLVLFLTGLDSAGYICRPKVLIPKVLKSLPASESMFSDGSEFTSPTFSIPVEIISKKFEAEQKAKSEVMNCEGGYADRKGLLEIDTSGTTTSGELPSAVSSSIESSGQANSSAEEDLSAGHLGDSMSSAVCIAHVPVSARDDSSNLPLDTSGVFNINLNTISTAEPADVWTSFKKVEVPQEEAEDSMESHEAGMALDQHNNICLDLNDLEEEYCSDYEEEEEDISENDDSNSHLISGYMRR